MPVTISVVIITKNEQRNIARCLAAADQVADEIVVVDSGSSDQTRAICESYKKVRFFVKEWAGFSATKNLANDLAHGDYILSLDADEELSVPLKDYLLKVKKELTPQSQRAFALDRLTNYCGQWIWHSGWRPDFQTRLFAKGQAAWDGAEVHESLRLRPQVQLERVKNLYLYHYSYYSIADHVERINKYSDLGAEEVVKKKKTGLLSRAFFNGLARFFKAYFLKLGILDGFYGFVIGVLSAYAVFLKYAKAKELMEKQKG